MLMTILSILTVSLIAAALAAVLVVADRVVSDYGQCEIDVNEGQRTFVIKGGRTLLDSLIEQKLFIPSACGGRGTCGYCKVRVTEGGGPLLPTEEPLLDKKEIEQSVRLSCQIKVKQNVRIRIPDALLSVREYVCEVAEIVELARNVRQIQFKLVDPDRMKFIPGQYMQLLTPIYEKSTEEVYRAYSISSDPEMKDRFELIIKLVPGGICTTWVFEYLKVGDTVRLNGPYGEFHLSGTEAPMICIAGGSGLAPIKCLLHQMKNTASRRQAKFFFGGNEVRDLYHVETMREFEKTLHDFEFVPVVARPEEGADWKGETGLVTEAVMRRYEDVSKHEAYLCGPPGMIDASIALLTKRGMSEKNIFFDKFS